MSFTIQKYCFLSILANFTVIYTYFLNDSTSFIKNSYVARSSFA